MRMRLPERLGFSKASRWLTRARDAISTSRPLPSANSQMMQTPRGTFNLSAPAKGGKSAPSAGMKFRGEHVPGLIYDPGDVVIIRGGITAGTYICVHRTTAGTPAPQDPPQDPSQGIFWIQIASGYAIGQWA